MIARLRVLSLVFLSIVAASVPNRGDAASSEPYSVRIRVLIVDARLRSAFLQRATGFDRSRPLATSAARQQELRDHFDAVLSLLVANTSRSLDTALDRLEQRRGEEWSTDERATWLQRLAQERLTNIRRLHRYQQRGMFPINEHDSDRAVPVFVDNYDTACAVGHLMRQAGWGEEVATIQANNNLVYVIDVADGPVVDWVITSGLTQEEAAIIQPGYPTTPSEEATLRANIPGSVTNRGILYRELSTRSESMYFFDEAVTTKLKNRGWPRELDYVSAYDDFVAGIRFGEAENPYFGTRFTPKYDRWMTLSGADQFGKPGYATSISAGTGQFSLLNYEFEVQAINPNQRVEAITLLSTPVVGFVNLGSGTAFAGMTVLSGSGEELGRGFLDSDETGHSFAGRRDITFAPHEHVKVFVEIVVVDNFFIGGLAHELRLITVPEPSSWSLAIIVVGVITSKRTRDHLRTDC